MIRVISFGKADKKDIREITALYNNLIDVLDRDENYPKWTKGVYPNRKYVKKHVLAEDLYVLRENGRIVGSAILNTDRISDYKNVPWTEPEIPESQVLTIHTFAIEESRRKSGVGSQFLRFIEDEAKSQGYKAIRLDTVYSNTPAVNFYEKAGYKNLGQQTLHYDETDETGFIVFEKNLNE